MTLANDRIRIIEQHEYYDCGGPPDGPAIVFIHATGWTRKMWQPQMQRLSDDFRVVSVDLPQHGQLHDVVFRLDDAIEYIHDAIEREVRGQVLVVGLSLGGYIATAYAHKYPERVAGLVLCSSSVGFNGALGMLTRISAWMFSLMVPHMPGRWLNYFARRQASALRENLAPEIAEQQIRAGFSLDAWGQAMGELVSQDFRAMLRTFPRPVLIVNGEHDAFNRWTEKKHLATTQQGSLQTVQGAGHVVNLEHPDQVAKILRTFAGSLDWRL